MVAHRYVLERSEYARQMGRKRSHICPSCGCRTFIRYVDLRNGGYLADWVGKCNREKSCGCHHRPSEYLDMVGKDEYFFCVTRKNRNVGSQVLDGKGLDKNITLPPRGSNQQKLGIIPMAQFVGLVDSWMGKDNLYRFLSRYYPTERLQEVWKAYGVFCSKRWHYHGGCSTVFPQVDRDGNCHQLKVMCFSDLNGRRLKKLDAAVFRKSNGDVVDDRMNDKIWFAGHFLLGDEVRLDQVPFGSHLIGEGDIIRIVESEKTALVCALSSPKDFDGVWVAMGGCNGVGWSSESFLSTISGHHVVLYPDGDMYDEWLSRALELQSKGYDVVVSTWLERKIGKVERSVGFDLADFILRKLQNGIPPKNTP